MFRTLIVVSCKCKRIGTDISKLNFELGIDVLDKVLRIESIGNYYLIFIENEEEFFKVVSIKNQTKYYDGIKVEIGENYRLKTNDKPTEVHLAQMSDLHL